MIARTDHADDAVVASAYEMGPWSALRPRPQGLRASGKHGRRQALAFRHDVVDSPSNVIG